MTDLEKGEFADRLRRTLHAKAELTPRVVGRRRLERPRHVRWIPLTAIGLVVAGVAGTVIVTRSDDQANVTPSLASSVDTASASAGICSAHRRRRPVSGSAPGPTSSLGLVVCTRPVS